MLQSRLVKATVRVQAARVRARITLVSLCRLSCIYVHTLHTPLYVHTHTGGAHARTDGGGAAVQPGRGVHEATQVEGGTGGVRCGIGAGAGQPEGATPEGTVFDRLAVPLPLPLPQQAPCLTDRLSLPSPLPVSHPQVASPALAMSDGLSLALSLRCSCGGRCA